MSERFFEKVEKTDSCWLWTGYRNPVGPKGNYGIIRSDTKRTMIKAHRASWEIHNGPIPDDACVLHKCDNPPCVNPDHLFLGTQRSNWYDMLEKRRHYKHNWTHCKRGHAFSEHGRIRKDGSRTCKVCERDVAKVRIERIRSVHTD